MTEERCIFFNAISIAQATLQFLWWSALTDNISIMSSWICATEMNSQVTAPADLSEHCKFLSAALHAFFSFGLSGVQKKPKMFLLV